MHVTLNILSKTRRLDIEKVVAKEAPNEIPVVHNGDLETGLGR
jgi:hypothetical protein